MGLKKILLFAVLSFVFVSYAQENSNINDDDKVIARIGKDYVVTQKDLKEYVATWRYERKYRVQAEAYKNALHDLIIGQLKRFDFFDRGLDKNQDLMKSAVPDVNNELLNMYFDKNFEKKYADDKMAADAYKEMDKEVVCKDIVLRIPANPTKENLDSLKTIALEIENALNNNININGVIRSHSIKGIGVNNKRTITWSETMVDPVANAVYNLKTGFTRVVELMDAFHIVKVLEINKIKLEPFEKIKDDIISKLQKGYYDLYNKEFQDYRTGLIDKNSLKWNQSGLDQIIKWSDNTSLYAGAFKDTIENALNKNNNFEILSYNKGKVDLKEYLRLLEEVIILNPYIVLSSNNVKEFILEAVYNDQVIKIARKKGMEKFLVTPYTKSTIMKHRFVLLYDQAVIDGSIPEATPEALKQFYEEHKDPIFYQLNKINIFARIYSDSIEAAEDINKIKNGTPFEKVSVNWWNKAYFRDRDGSLKTYRTNNEPPYLAKAAFKLGLNECAGPVEYYDSTKGKQFAVIKCVYLQPEKQLTYEEVKGKRVEEEFKNYYRQKISDEVDAMLKKKYDVQIFDNAYSGAF